jgi:DNA-binding FadR family transcriptional regulator
MDFDKLQPEPAYKLLSGELRRRIVQGELGQGQALPTEAELAQRFGVHRSTVREGLRQLEQEGLLRRAGKKLLVSMPQAGDLALIAERALRMRQVSLLDVWQVATALEPLGAGLAASRIDAAQLAELEQRLAAMATLVAAGLSPVDADIAFLDQVAACARNPALLLARAPVSLLMRAGYAAIAPALPQSGARLIGSHRQLLDALQQRDSAAAAAAMHKHIADYRRGCEVAGMDMAQPIPLAS